MLPKGTARHPSEGDCPFLILSRTRDRICLDRFSDAEPWNHGWKVSCLKTESAKRLREAKKISFVVVILTDGVRRQVQLGKLTLVFHRPAPRNLLGAGHPDVSIDRASLAFGRVNEPEAGGAIKRSRISRIETLAAS
jgi:hypothetical protein